MIRGGNNHQPRPKTDKERRQESLAQLRTARLGTTLTGFDGRSLSDRENAIEITNFTFTDSDFSNARKLKLQNVRMSNSNFSGATFVLPMKDSELTGCNFSGAHYIKEAEKAEKDKGLLK
jgi:uncharacterized protein YjbI with pentapeptide repeats